MGTWEIWCYSQCDYYCDVIFDGTICDIHCTSTLCPSKKFIQILSSMNPVKIFHWTMSGPGSWLFVSRALQVISILINLWQSLDLLLHCTGIGQALYFCSCWTKSEIGQGLDKVWISCPISVQPHLGKKHRIMPSYLIHRGYTHQSKCSRPCFGHT